MASLAHRYGFADLGEIYDHPRNAPLKQRRPNPYVLAPGDEVFIPDRDATSHSCGTGAAHQFVRRRPPTVVRLKLVGADGRSRTGMRYRLVVGDQRYEDDIGSDGIFEHPVDPSAREARLSLWTGGDAPVEILLSLGDLDPVDTARGAQSRLINLGFDCGGDDGVLGARTRGALVAYQQARHLEPTGEPDEATRARLLRDHDGA